MDTSTSTTTATSTTSQSLRIINTIFQRLNPLHQSRPRGPRNRGAATTDGPQVVPWDPAVSGLNNRPKKDVRECFWLLSVTEDAKSSRWRQRMARGSQGPRRRDVESLAGGSTNTKRDELALCRGSVTKSLEDLVAA
jgi:hypothetical protein